MTTRYAIATGLMRTSAPTSRPSMSIARLLVARNVIKKIRNSTAENNASDKTLFA